MNRFSLASLLAALVACALVSVAGSAPGAGLPLTDAAAPIDGGPRRPALMPGAHDGGRDGGEGTHISRTPPDPPPIVARKQWIFDLRYAKGDIYLLGVHPMDLGAPQATPRAMGRFAIELYEGPALVERVRFDFPFLGTGDLPMAADAGLRERDDARMLGPLDKHLTTRIGVMVPDTSRGNRLELWDRATDKRWPLPWPPMTGSDGGTR